MINAQTTPPGEKKKRIREGIIISISLLLIIILTIVELRLTQLSSQAPLWSNIVTFGIINVIILLIILLVYLVFRNVAKLFIEKRSNIIGAKLRTKLVISFVGLSLVPTMLLFFVSAGYITNSIQNWFNKQIETALDESLEVAQTYYKSYGTNALYYGRQISTFIKNEKLLNDENLPQLRQLIQQKQNEYNLGIVEVYSSTREELVRASNSRLPKGEFTNPASEDIQSGLNGKELTKVNAAGKADLIRGIVPIYSNWNAKDVVGVVVVNYYVPYSLVNKMKEINKSYTEFKQLKIMKNPITTGYILTLFLITLTIIFLAIWFGLYLARSMTTPLQELALATKQVAEGNLDIHLQESGTEEISLVVNAFNQMTEELKANRQTLQRTNEELSVSNLELEQRRRYMETVLKNMTAGVISADKQGILSTVNKSAERLLHINAASVLGKDFREVLKSAHLDFAKTMLRDMIINRKDSVSQQMTLTVHETKLTLLVNLSVMRDENGEFIGTVVVFDDLTQLMKAQRMAAWREVARRIAHEIKNPLTPIQLSAQRLRKRYLDRFSDEDLVFDQCTAMIIKSVDELKSLVDEFSRFARMPAAQLAPNDLNEVITEAVALYQESHRQISFAFTQDQAIPLLSLDRDQIKRVFINLFENAIAAIGSEGSITISTRYNPDVKLVSCAVADSGHGIPADDKPRLFEPYFSTKKTGTGLGLTIVSTIISDHHGFIRVKDNHPQGTIFTIELPVTISS